MLHMLHINNIFGHLSAGKRQHGEIAAVDVDKSGQILVTNWKLSQKNYEIKPTQRPVQPRQEPGLNRKAEDFPTICKSIT